MSKSFIKGYIVGRCISEPIKLEVLKHEISNLKRGV